MTEKIRVAVAGAAGRMGRASIRTVAAQPDMVLVAAVGRTALVGTDAGTAAGMRPLGVAITSDLEAALTADVLVDFSPGPAAARHAAAAVPAGISPVIGGTGLSASELTDLAGLCEARGVGAVVAPNFAVGAVLMMEFARQAAPHFPRVEIIELMRSSPHAGFHFTFLISSSARWRRPACSRLMNHCSVARKITG